MRFLAPSCGAEKSNKFCPLPYGNHLPYSFYWVFTPTKLAHDLYTSKMYRIRHCPVGRLYHNFVLLQNARRIYKCILYSLFQQPKKTSVNNTETPFLVTTLVLKRKVNVTVIIFDIASPVCVISVMKFANNQKHCKYA